MMGNMEAKTMTKNCIGQMSGCELINECRTQSPDTYGECARAVVQHRIPKPQPSEKGGQVVTGSNRVATRDKALQVEVTMSERGFQVNVIALAKMHGWMVYHTHDSRRSEPGFPDLVLVHRRRRLLLYRELKTDKGKVTWAQQDWLDALSAIADAGVWRPRDWKLIMEELEV